MAVGTGHSDSDGGNVLDSTLATLHRCLHLGGPPTAGPSSSCTEQLTSATLPVPSSTPIAITEVTSEPSEASSLPGDQHQFSEDEPPSGQAQSDRCRQIKVLDYKDETQIGDIMRLITKDLSEPYSIYTYRYFIHGWPELCLLALDSSSQSYVGAVVCKLDSDNSGRRKGYIAMLAVDESCRRLGIGTRLVRHAIERMQQKGCDEVILETEVTNKEAVRLYTNLGFIREKRLFRYYLNGVDAFRLKLYFSPPTLGYHDF